jgi:hypothetical protein
MRLTGHPDATTTRGYLTSTRLYGEACQIIQQERSTRAALPTAYEIDALLGCGCRTRRVDS